MVLLHMLKDGLPSAFCFKFRKSKPDHQETEGFIATEDELKRLEKNVARLLQKISQCEDDVPISPEEECVVCNTVRASMQTFPCGHIVLCRKCFIRTVQMTLSERNFPLQCVVCRCPVVRLKQQTIIGRITLRPHKAYAPIITSEEPAVGGHSSSCWLDEYTPNSSLIAQVNSTSRFDHSIGQSKVSFYFAVIQRWFRQKGRLSNV